MAFSIVLDMNSDFKDASTLLAERGLSDGGRAQQALDRAAVEFCMPYVPFKTGALMQSAASSVIARFAMACPMRENSIMKEKTAVFAAECGLNA